MKKPIYLSIKAATIPAVIYIKVNSHNPSGWVENPNGDVGKFVNKK